MSATVRTVPVTDVPPGLVGLLVIYLTIAPKELRAHVQPHPQTSAKFVDRRLQIALSQVLRRTPKSR